MDQRRDDRLKRKRSVNVCKSVNVLIRITFQNTTKNSQMLLRIMVTKNWQGIGVNVVTYLCVLAVRFTTGKIKLTVEIYFIYIRGWFNQ
jgi:hypothetical protein